MSANPSGIPFYLNRAGHEILGVAQDRDIAGMKTLYLHPEWAREIFAKDGLQEAIRHGSWAGETTILARNGKEIPVSQVLIAHKSTEGEVEYFSTVLRDMTEYREAEEALRLSQQKLLETSRLAGMAEVATGVLHNVGNVLNSVNVSAGLVVERLRRSKAPKLAKAVAPIRVDRHKVLQILINLIRNAKYALDEVERIDKKIAISISAPNERCIQIVVSDNGIGISPENLTRIFAHGFTTREGGHGFGLHSGAIAARWMGGSITVASAGIGQGASFTLELPIASTASVT